MNDHVPLRFIPPVGPTPRQRAMEIIGAIADSHNVEPAEILGPSLERKRLAYPRFEAMRRISAELGWSSTKIGRLFNRDHTTVLHALGRLQRTPGDMRRLARDQEAMSA